MEKTEQQPQVQDSPEAIVRAYFDAFQSRDLDRCMEYFGEDSSIAFMSGVFKGRRAIEEWHKERFAADLQITKIGPIKAKDDTVTADVTVTSNRLKQWKVASLGGRAVLRVKQGKIRDTKLNPRISNPFEKM